MWGKVNKKQGREQSELRKSHHFTLMKPFQPEEFNTYTKPQYNDIQNLSRYLVSYHNKIQY